jgi:DNA polymerase
MDNFQHFEQQAVHCQKCSLAKTRLNVVFGEGNQAADILFIGEAPGASEDKAGRPFCGRAGEVLDRLLAKANLSRQDVYIANILKCRPPGNRNPQAQEIESCSPYLDQQIKLIKPKIICCMGNFATSYIMGKFGLRHKVKGISKIHGQVFITQTSLARLRIVPLYHPAVATYNANMINILAKDFIMLRNMPRG